MTLPAPNQLQTLRVRQHDVDLGQITVTDLDFPWVTGSFEPTPDFEQARPLFDQLSACPIDDPGLDQWDALYEQLMQTGICLVDEVSGAVITEFILHIEENWASFRY